MQRLQPYDVDGKLNHDWGCQTMRSSLWQVPSSKHHYPCADNIAMACYLAIISFCPAENVPLREAANPGAVGVGAGDGSPCSFRASNALFSSRSCPCKRIPLSPDLLRLSMCCQGAQSSEYYAFTYTL